MYEGIIDYLEVMKLAGVAEVKKAPNARAAGISLSNAPPPSPKENPSRTGGVGAKTLPSHTPSHPESLSKREKTVAAPVALVPIDVAPIDVASINSLQDLANAVAACNRCPELATFRTQTVFGVGNPNAELVFLGEAPGRDEDEQGEPFVGRAGQLLTDIIVKGMKMQREDVYICNILRCRPPGNRNPMPDEAAHCRPFLDRTLELIKPKFICCLGAVAAKNLLASEQTIVAMRGKVWNYKGITVVCTYHPAYLLRNPAAKKDTWDDIQLLLKEMERDE